MMVEIAVDHTLIQNTVLTVNAKNVTNLIGSEMGIVMIPLIHQVGKKVKISIDTILWPDVT